MMPTRIIALVIFLLLGAPSRAQVPSLSEAAGRYSLVADHSSLAFTVSAVGGPGIKGRFMRFDGNIDIPADDMERARVMITIYPESVTTGQERIDNFLKSDAVFDTANEKAITFVSTHVTRTGEDTAVIEGNLTARGRTFGETFNVQLAEFRGTEIRLHVEGQVYRSRYGMDVGTPLYSNVVDFDMDLAVVRR